MYNILSEVLGDFRFKTEERNYQYSYTIKPSNFLILSEEKQNKKLEEFFYLLKSIQKELFITLTRSLVTINYKGKKTEMQVLQVLLDSDEPLDDILERLGFSFSRDEKHLQLKVAGESLRDFTTYASDEKIFGRAFTLEQMPAMLPPAWIHRIFAGFHRIHILINPIRPDKATRIVSNKEGAYTDRAVRDERDKKRLEDIRALKEALGLGLTKLYSFTINGFVFTDSYKKLHKLDQIVRRNLAAFNTVMTDSYAQQANMVNGGGNAWFGALESCAMFYPFASADMLETPNGIVLGINRDSNSPIIYDPKNRKNHNIFVCGSQGSGKSFTSKITTKRFQDKHPNTMCIIIDPQEEYLPHAKYFGLDGIRIEPGKPYGLDPFRLFKEKSEVVDILESFTGAPPEVVKQWRSVCENINSIKELEQKSNDLGKKYLVDLIKGPLAKMFEGETRFSDRMIISLKETENQEIEKLLILLTLTWAWKRVNSLPSNQWKYILLDEAWRMTKLEKSAQRIGEITREGRKRSLVFAVATQQFTDLDKIMDEDSKITDLFDTKIIMHLNNTAAKGVGEALDLTEHEVERIQNFQKGEGIIFTSDNTIYAKFEATEEERLDYFNTDEEKEEWST